MRFNMDEMSQQNFGKFFCNKKKSKKKGKEEEIEKKERKENYLQPRKI